jgi:hypothetical protein
LLIESATLSLFEELIPSTSNPINAKQQFEAIFEAPKGSYNLSNGREATTLYLKPSTAVNLTRCNKFMNLFCTQEKAAMKAIF